MGAGGGSGGGGDFKEQGRCPAMRSRRSCGTTPCFGTSTTPRRPARGASSRGAAVRGAKPRVSLCLLLLLGACMRTTHHTFTHINTLTAVCAGAKAAIGDVSDPRLSWFANVTCCHEQDEDEAEVADGAGPQEAGGGGGGGQQKQQGSEMSRAFGFESIDVCTDHPPFSKHTGGSHPWTLEDDLPLFPPPLSPPSSTSYGASRCELHTDARGRPAVARTTAPPAGAAAASSSYVLRASGPEGAGGDATAPTTTSRTPSEAAAAAASVAIVRVGALLLAALALVWGGVLRSWRAGRGRHGGGERELEAVGLDGSRAARSLQLQGDEREEGEEEEEEEEAGEDDGGERGPLLLRPAACTVYGSTHG